MSVVPSPVMGDVVDQVSSWTPGRDDPDGEFIYVDVSTVDQDSKTIASPRRLACTDAPSRARQIIRSGDVLVSTVRPNLNAVGRVPVELDGATASTGFCVLRPRSDVADGAYLFHWVRSPRFVGEMVRRATGASYPAVSDRIVFESKIPLPSFPEQRRIAAILDKADALRAKRRAVLVQLDTLTQSNFLDMFGDPATNPKGFERSTIDLVSERVTDGEHLTPKRTTEGIKLLSARNIRDGYIDFENVDYISTAEHERIRKRCDPSPGDILISCSGTIGRVASVDTAEPFSLVRSAAMVRPKRSHVRTKFLAHYLRTPALKAQMLRRANASSQANLFQGQIRELPVLLPPLSQQDSFVVRVACLEKLKAAHSASLKTEEALFATLQQRAFRGEL